MATHKIGNFKFNISKQGFAFRMGDGETHRIGFGGRSRDGDRDYDRYDYDRQEGDAYADDSDYNYDEDDGGYDDRYDGGYDDESYDGDYDDSYDEGSYDDGDYDDGGYDDGGNGGDEGYYDDDAGYYGDEGPSAGPVMEYIENHPWVVLVLLVVLPPLGIYLLWRLRRYEFPIRVGLSVVSAIWFIIALILIFSGIFKGGSDTPTLPEMTLTTVAPTTAAPTAAPVVSAEPTQTAGLDIGDIDLGDDLTPAATPIGQQGGQTGDTGTGEYVYSPQTGLYYHKTSDCSRIDPGVQVTLVTLQAALNRNQAACPLCFGGQVYYATPNGKHYHTNPTCSDMKDAVEYSKEAAENEGKTACPVCAGGVEEKDEDEGKTKAQKYLESLHNDKSGVKVWMTKKGKWYHTTKDCKGMVGAKEVTLLAALQSGKTGCPTCASGANKIVYCTSGGKNYHLDPNCKNMKDAKKVTLALAMVLGKTRCTTCVTEDFYKRGTTPEETATKAPSNTGKPGSSATPAPADSPEVIKPKRDGSTVYVFATPNGRYYHTNSACSDMKNAQKVTLLSMIEEGRSACPECCSSANDKVYVVKDGKYYHSYATCTDMKNAREGTLAQALAYGYKVCPKCWSGNKPKVPSVTPAPGDKPGDDDGNDGYSNVYVYASEKGTYYHTKKNCSKADSDVGKVLLELAMDDGKKACPVCASAAEETVYAVKGGKYYHKLKTCKNLSGGKAGTLAKALVQGFKACPVCVKGDSKDPGSAKYKPGTSGIDVYATATGKYFHTVKSCSGISGKAVKVSLEAALNNNRSACPVCASAARRTVYAHKSGKYYHYSSSCAGSSASNGMLANALAMGYKPCPNCVTGSPDNDKKPKFEVGKSGIKVYASTSGKYFHTDKKCGSLKNPRHIALETALNYGLKACPTCAAAAGKKVYAAPGSGTYHYDESCAGDGAVSGTLAEALASGMKPCKKCVNGITPVPPDDDDDRKAPGSTKVYIDLSGKTSTYLYHKSAKCPDCGMTGGTAVTLKYALEQGFSDCGFCRPPTTIEK